MNIILLGKRGSGKTWTAVEIQSHLLQKAIIHDNVDWADVPVNMPATRDEIHIWCVRPETAPLANENSANTSTNG